MTPQARQQTKQQAKTLSPDELQAWYAFLQTHHALLRVLDAEVTDEHELPLASYDVLLWLAQSPGRSMKMADLAKVALLSPSGLTRLVDRLVASGLVERRPSGGDGRVMLAHLTDKGRDKFRRAAPTHVRGIKQHFASRLDERDLRDLVRVMQKVNGPAQCPQPVAIGSRAASSNGRRVSVKALR